jgi:two-component system, chemotaxis family, CheB/CheR fusion protein
MQPDLVLSDSNRPNDMNGVQVSQKLRQQLDRRIPFVILTGDISTGALRDIALHDCVHLSKPVRLNDLTRAIEKLLAKPPDHRTAGLDSSSRP